ncbi:MAG: UbiD family decarboxylase [Candidatus Aenigmarchaeota archaeon]|nr:UbiD family decarboxylase [Candidatus Aenigmarchaeota archaeon]
MRDFIEKLEKTGKLVKIKKPVSKKYEIAALMKRLDGKPVLFEKVKESRYPVAANICSTRDLLSAGLGIKKEDFITKMPILTHYKEDGGPYLSSAIVVINDKKIGLNSSFHRMMVIGKDKLVARILPRHFDEYIKRGNKNFVICIGNSPQVLLASAISCELGKSELSIANAIKKTDLMQVDGLLASEAEFILLAEITGEQHDEGPFMDLTETFDIVRKQQVIKIKKIYARKNPIYHALLPGGLEHKILMGLPREPTIFREVSKVCKCKNVLITPGGCSWLHAVVQIKKQNADDGRKAIEAAFKGHSSAKHVFVVDDDTDPYNWSEIEWAMATRFQGDKDIIMKKDKGSSLDPSADPNTRNTTKIGFDLTIPWDKKIEDFKKHKIPMEDKINPDDYR